MDKDRDAGVEVYRLYCCPDCNVPIGTRPPGLEAPAREQRCPACQRLQDRLEPLLDRLDKIIALLTSN